MSMESSDDLLPDSLLIAIGRIATSSARLEGALRHVVGELFRNPDAGWIIFEGQSIDSLITNGNALLSEYVEDDEGNNSHLRGLFNEAGALSKDRNVVIHGEWTKECFFKSEPEGCKPHSPDSLHSDKLFHVARSRRGKGLEEEAWSVSDIEDLASKINAVTLKLNNARW
jgi:hypothetical protein